MNSPVYMMMTYVYTVMCVYMMTYVRIYSCVCICGGAGGSVGCALEVKL